jgi:hypothetical protein
VRSDSVLSGSSKLFALRFVAAQLVDGVCQYGWFSVGHYAGTSLKNERSEAYFFRHNDWAGHGHRFSNDIAEVL